MKWYKNGFVYVAQGNGNWAHSHAYLPTPILLNAETIRIFLAFRNMAGIGRVGYVDVAANNPLQILSVSKRPVFDIGSPGSFDDNGVTPISVVREGEKLFLFYTGWQLGVTVPYQMYTGVAVSIDNGENFERIQPVPILDRSNSESVTRTASHVRKEGNIWRMWYAAGDDWIKVNEKLMPSYDIRYLSSNSVTQWDDTGAVCISAEGKDEFGIGRPFIFKEKSEYRMIYSIRSKSKGYRLGYAESRDGLDWIRKDNEVGIDVSVNGWDSSMICFGAIQSTAKSTYLFYNGNNYGETGFGVATLTDEKNSFSC